MNEFIMPSTVLNPNRITAPITYAINFSLIVALSFVDEYIYLIPSIVSVIKATAYPISCVTYNTFPPIFLILDAELLFLFQRFLIDSVMLLAYMQLHKQKVTNIVTIKTAMNFFIFITTNLRELVNVGIL